MKNIKTHSKAVRKGRADMNLSIRRFIRRKQMNLSFLLQHEYELTYSLYADIQGHIPGYSEYIYESNLFSWFDIVNDMGDDYSIYKVSGDKIIVSKYIG